MTKRGWLLAALLLPIGLAACESAPGSGTPVQTATTAGATVTMDLDGRPFKLHLPTSYTSTTTMPLLVMLHGYTSNAAEAETYFKLTAESDRRGFLYAMPDGTKDSRGKRFWNASDACCNFDGSDVDDSTYLQRLIETVKSKYLVDAGRVFVVGHSNGGFMAHRMACDHPELVTAIVSFAGAAPNDPARCTPARPVTVLQIHGTADSTIHFDGGTNAGRPYPSATASLAMWRRLDGCSDEASTTAAPMDLESSLPGAETTVTTYSTSCRENTRVVLWSIAGGDHVPALTSDYAPSVTDFLLAQPVRR